VSAENVELIRALHLGPDVDVATLVNDDGAAERLRLALGRSFHPTVQCTMRFPGMTPVTYAGLDGLRLAWRDWLKQWASYRVEIDDIIDGGERVVVLLRVHGRREPGAPEVTRPGATVWTLSDHRVAKVDFNVPYGEALAAAS
jgi:SnoaL-like domain